MKIPDNDRDILRRLVGELAEVAALPIHKERVELRDVLEKTRGCNVEIILKDISTVRHEPKRLWEWSQIAAEEAQRIGG